MTEPVWLKLVDVLGIHDLMLGQYGGLAGVRDVGLLESAIARPQNLFLYEEANIHRLASAYAFGIVRNHPFVDGNKRTGFMVAATFLVANGWKLVASEASVVEHTLALASGTMEELIYSVWLIANSREL